MDFRLNKVDMDVRQKVNETRSDDKIHNKKGINVNKDKNKDESSEKFSLNKDDSTEKLLTTEEHEEIPKDVKDSDPQKGHFIDIRR